jgi:hypothetical protein
MSITYHLIPVDDTMKSPEFTQWFGRALPENLQPGRDPDVTEFTNALKQIPEYEIRKEGPPQWIIYRNGELYLNIESGTFYLTFLEPHGFRFSGDGDGVIKIVSKLPPECGSFVMVTDWDDPELVVAGVGRIAG